MENNITSALWLPCTQMQQLQAFPPLHIERGLGVYLYDKAGNSYIDAISSWWVNLHGHCHPYINQQLKQQLDVLEHTLLAGVLHPSIVQLAEALVAITPTALTKAFFADSGSAAVECALKMSLQSWHQQGKPQKNTFVSLAEGYHGETLGSLAVTDIPLFRKQYAPLLIQHLRVPSPADIFCATEKTQAEHEADCLAVLEKLFAEKHQQICGFILEPLVQGACGMGMYSANYLVQAKKLCSEYGIHLIADEIAVGFGRTGSMFACEQAGITPDFMCLSKGLTAGYLPMSCVLTTEAIYHTFLDDSLERGFLHSHSFTGNPLAARAALASLAVFHTEDTLANNQKKMACISQKLQSLSTQLATQEATQKAITACRQTGMIAAFTVQHKQQIGRKIHQYALAHGVLVRPIGNQVYIMPPYCITLEEIDRLFAVLAAAVAFAITQPHQANADDNIDPKLLA